jgi:hypothetical protein
MEVNPNSALSIMPFSSARWPVLLEAVSFQCVEDSGDFFFVAHKSDNRVLSPIPRLNAQPFGFTLPFWEV